MVTARHRVKPTVYEVVSVLHPQGTYKRGEGKIIRDK